MESTLRWWDRVARALFVGLAVGLGWGIRGDFGHLLGAMYPGAVLGLAFAFVSGQKSMFRWMPLLGAVSGLGIAAGGAMSYGLLHGYAKADTFLNYTYGFFTLMLQGGAWGAFGCAFLGLALEKDRVKATEFVSLVTTVLLCGSVVYFVVVNLVGFHINPPRSDLSIAYTGGVVGLFLWLGFSKRRYGLRGALLGYIGFGLGMAGGRLLGNLSYLQPYPVNHWNIMEVMCGVIGGFVFTFGMLGKQVDDPSEEESMGLLSAYGAFLVMAWIPLGHRLLRIPANEKLAQWTKSLASYGYADPATLSEYILIAINLVCVLGFIGAAFWLYFHFTNRPRAAWFPVIWLSLLMLLIQNLHALYFFYPRQEGTINMHFVFWVMFGLMVFYVVFIPRRDRTVPDEQIEQVPWRRWVLGAVAAFALIVLLAGYINSDKTMASANTLWPKWSWRDGTPFPGR